MKISFIDNHMTCNKLYIVIESILDNGTVEFDYIPWNSENYKMIEWFKTNVIDYTIETREFPKNETQLVRLRIAINMLFKLNIDNERKIELSEILKNMYYELQKETFQWYIANVLPF